VSDKPAAPPENVAAPAGLQHERTALAWERTAISMMVAGIVLARYAASDAHAFVSAVGIAQTVGGGVLLVWAGRHNEQLHDLLSPAPVVPQVNLTRAIGLSAVVFTGASLGLAVVLILAG